MGGTTTYRLVCQDRADFELSGGDSGSPVFHIYGSNSTEGSFVGILHTSGGQFTRAATIKNLLGNDIQTEK